MAATNRDSEKRRTLRLTTRRWKKSNGEEIPLRRDNRKGGTP